MPLACRVHNHVNACPLSEPRPQEAVAGPFQQILSDNGFLLKPAKLYRSIGGASGCHALATAFYAQVEQDPVLRPLFPSTFTCAIEEFSAFLVQFLGGEAD